MEKPGMSGEVKSAEESEGLLTLKWLRKQIDLAKQQGFSLRFYINEDRLRFDLSDSTGSNELYRMFMWEQLDNALYASRMVSLELQWAKNALNRNFREKTKCQLKTEPSGQENDENV